MERADATRHRAVERAHGVDRVAVGFVRHISDLSQRNVGSSNGTDHRFFRSFAAAGWDDRRMHAREPAPRPLRRRALIRRRRRLGIDPRRRIARHRLGRRRAAARARRGALGVAARAAPRAAHRRARRGRLDTARSHPFEAGTVEEVDAATIEVLHATTGALLEVGTNLTDAGRRGEAAPAPVQPPHVLVRAERLGQDLRARRRARAARRAHRAAGRDLRPELRLRAARRAQPRGERARPPRRSRNATSACSVPRPRATPACGHASST